MANIELLLADAEDLVLGSLLAPQWGVYLNGDAVISPANIFSQTISSFLAPVQEIASLLGVQTNLVPVTASTVEFEFSEDWPISNYPQEQGAFQSYDKVTLPFDVRLKLASGGSASERQQFLQTCLAIGASLSLFDVVTPEMVFTSVNCTHVDWRRTATDGVELIKVDLWFQQISVSAGVLFSSTQQPGNAGQQSIGNVQPGVPSNALSGVPAQVT